MISDRGHRPKVTPPPRFPEGTRRTGIERGRDLVWSIGCNDCHTPKKMGPSGPYAFNLTPDETTGIGIWTWYLFIRALRSRPSSPRRHSQDPIAGW